MALGAISRELAGGGRPLEPLFFDHIQFLGDDDYPAGGTVGFSDLVATALAKEGVEVVGILKAGACGGYEPIYDKANDKLLMYIDNNSGANGPEIEVTATTNLDSVTIDLVVLYR